MSADPLKLGVVIGMEYEGRLSDGTFGEIFMTPDSSLHTYRLNSNVTRFFTNVRGPMLTDQRQYFRDLCQSLPGTCVFLTPNREGVKNSGGKRQA